MNELRKGNAEYFKSLFAELNANGPAALLAFLQSYDLTGFNVRVAPETEGLLEQKLAGLRDFDKWWLEVLRRGDLADDWETGRFALAATASRTTITPMPRKHSGAWTTWMGEISEKGAAKGVP